MHLTALQNIEINNPEDYGLVSAVHCSLNRVLFQLTMLWWWTPIKLNVFQWSNWCVVWNLSL